MTAPRARIGWALTEAVRWLERRGWLVMGLIACLYLAAVLDASRHKPLWHDELFTWYISQAPTLSAMWSDLSTHDLNPPLIYLLTRLSFWALGVCVLAVRLPEIAAFLLTLLCLYGLVRQRMGVLYGAFAAMLLLAGKTFDLAYESRPYSLLLAFTALTMLAWQQADERRHRRLALIVLPLACAGMLLSHVFAILSLAALLAAEGWRTRLRRTIDWPVAAGLLAPLAVTAIYAPMLRNHSAAIFPVFLVPTGNTIFEFYVWTLDRELVSLLLIGFAVLLLLGVNCLRGAGAVNGPRWFFPVPEWILIAGLLLGPLLLLGELMLTHAAFFNRYGAVASLGMVLLFTAVLARWTATNGHLDARSALLGLGIVLLISGRGVVPFAELQEHTLVPTRLNSEPVIPPCQACLKTAALSTAIPLVAASGLTFVELSHNEPMTAARLFYLTDANASTHYAHANIFERMPQLVDRFHLASHAETYASFTARHPHFFVLGSVNYPEDWLLPRLLDDHATVRLIFRPDDLYRDHELYEVTLAPNRP